jgi:hypothetical protein
MIDLRNETLISLMTAARMLPPGRRGRPVSLSCVLRWVIDGVRLPSGEVVHLEAIRCGGRWLTSTQSLQRFVERQTPRLDCRPGTPRTPGRRQRASERAAAELDKIGI